jgi:NADPH-dependent 2,4-dienoyl-CoA reductase/sulfur reductase-like enzyme
MGVDLRMGVTATQLDLTRRLVHYRDEQAVTYAEPFDELVLATGAPAVVPGWASAAAA